MLSLGNIFIVLLFYTLNSENLSVQELLQAQRVKYLPVSRDECQRFHVRRRHVLDDSFLRFNAGFKENKYIKVTFAAEAAVDEGGPLREYFRLLLGEIAKKNSMFCGDEECRVPVHNMDMWKKKSYYSIGAMLAASLVHGGPAPKFFAKAVADYFVYGMSGVRATPEDIPNFDIQLKILKVCISIILLK